MRKLATTCLLVIMTALVPADAWTWGPSTCEVLRDGAKDNLAPPDTAEPWNDIRSVAMGVDSLSVEQLTVKVVRSATTPRSGVLPIIEVEWQDPYGGDRYLLRIAASQAHLYGPNFTKVPLDVQWRGRVSTVAIPSRMAGLYWTADLWNIRARLLSAPAVGSTLSDPVAPVIVDQVPDAGTSDGSGRFGGWSRCWSRPDFRSNSVLCSRFDDVRWDAAGVGDESAVDLTDIVIGRSADKLSIDLYVTGPASGSPIDPLSYGFTWTAGGTTHHATAAYDTVSKAWLYSLKEGAIAFAQEGTLITGSVKDDRVRLIVPLGKLSGQGRDARVLESTSASAGYGSAVADLSAPAGGSSTLRGCPRG